MHKTWLRLAGDRRAVTALEYGIIAAAVAIAIVSALSSMGQNLTNLLGNVANSL